MSINRTPISSIMGASLSIREATAKDQEETNGYVEEGSFVLYRRDNLKIVASVNRHDLFDEFGNRFDYYS